MMKNNYLVKFVVGCFLVAATMMTGRVMAAFDVKDTMSSSAIANDALHRIELNIISDEIINNGSIKFNFDDEFNFSGLQATDVTIAGGDVIWGMPMLDLLNDVIVVPFVGDLNNTDGIIHVTIGSVNYIDNPIIGGYYKIAITTHHTVDGSGDYVEYKDMGVVITSSVVVSASVPQTLIFVVSGVGDGEDVNGVLTNVISGDNVVDFGTLLGAGERIGAQDLSVSTNASDGYMVTIEYDHALSSGLNSISDWTGTNAAPTSWVNPMGSSDGYFGYTTSDNSLYDPVVNRFISNKWAGNWSSPKEVMYHDAPADGLSPNTGKVRVGYRLGVTDWQETGIYTSTVTYVCTPSF